MSIEPADREMKMETKDKQTKRHAPQKVFEALSGSKKIGEVALSRDGMTWVAGILENNAIVHIGSFATLEEAKTSLEERLPAGKKAVAWRQTRAYEITD
jgi:hypothetical protein